MSEFYFYTTPLHTAILNENHEEVYNLIKNNADIYAKDDDGTTCYELAIAKNNDVIIRMFEASLTGMTIKKE